MNMVGVRNLYTSGLLLVLLLAPLVVCAQTCVIGNCPRDIVMASGADRCGANVIWTKPSPERGCTSTLTSNRNPGDFFPIGTTTVTYTATDMLGRATTCSFNVIVTDNTPPVIANCPVDIRLLTRSGRDCRIIGTWKAPTASDNCSVIMTSDYDPGHAFPVGVTTVTYTARDGANNVATCSFNVSVTASAVDDLAPAFSQCPADITVYADASCQAEVTWTPPVPTDNCTTVSTQSDHAPGDTFPMGKTTVTYTARDAAGNKATCAFVVTVRESIKPIFVKCPDDIIAPASLTTCDAVVHWTAPDTGTNNCILTVTSDHQSGDTFPVGVTPVTYTARDGEGNTSTCSFNIRVRDDTGPSLTGCPENITVSASASGQAVVRWTEPVTSDNCIVTLTSTHSSGSTFPIGTTQVMYTAGDETGNEATCSFRVTVVDNTAPVLTNCPPDIMTYAQAGCGIGVTWTEPGVTDHSSVTLTSDHQPGEFFYVGTTMVTYIARDAAGHATYCSFNVVVADDIAPVISQCPETILVPASASCDTRVDWDAPLVSDNCDAVLTSTHTPGDVFHVGKSTVTYTARDGSGNVSFCSFQVIVEDLTAPVIAECPADIAISSGTSQCGASAHWSIPNVTDNCTQTPTVSATHTPGDFFPIGTTTVAYTATDAAGNTATCSFNVVVTDNTPPVFQNCPADISTPANGSCSSEVYWTPPAASDNCGIASVTSSHLPGTSFNAGTTEVTYTATDTEGNVTMCRFNVTLPDITPPVITGCPADVEVRVGETGKGAAYWTPPTGFSLCGQLSVTSTHVPGDIFPIGSTPVRYTAVNDAGSSTSCTFSVIVAYHDFNIDVSRIVTPDGDGVNDVWVLSNIEKFEYNNVLIVDRWGSEVYRAAAYNNGDVVWRGTNSRGGEVPTGTYFYFIEVNFRAQHLKQSGSIELIR